MWIGKDYRSARSSRRLVGQKTVARPLTIAVVSILVLIVGYFFFFNDEPRVEEDLDAMKARLDHMEKRFSHIENQIKNLQQSLARGPAKTDEPVTARAEKDRYHVVQRGDTLSRIAQRYDLTVTDLCRLNNITPESVIRRDQKLLISFNNPQQ